jgi:hypothetical protein
MIMKITPRSEQEINEMGVFPAGEYDFEVIGAKEELSKAGDEMLHLICRVWPSNGDSPIQIHDYLLDAHFKSMAQKLRNFCFVTGLENEYRQGGLIADVVLGRTGRCAVEVQKDRNGEYHDRNVIVDYVGSMVLSHRMPASMTPENTMLAAPNLNDIPF